MTFRRDTSFNAEKLREKYPEVAEVFEKVLEDRKDMYHSTSINYYNKYPNRAKGVSMGLVLEILEENEIPVTIKILNNELSTDNNSN